MWGLKGAGFSTRTVTIVCMHYFIYNKGRSGLRRNLNFSEVKEISFKFILVLGET